MNTENTKCCQGCKNGQPGRNKSCQAKLMMKKLSKQVNKPLEKTQEV